MSTLAVRDLVERKIGRPLRAAEQAIDLALLDSALNTGKDELEQAIRDDMLRAARSWQRTRTHPRLTLTKAMRTPLEQLHDLGRDEAYNELQQLCYTAASRPRARGYARFSAPNPNPGFGYDEAIATVERGLLVIGIRLEDELVVADLADASSLALARALLKIPGARDLASRVVSTALFSGMALTFDENQALVEEWEITAAMDAGTCAPCASHDGEHGGLHELLQLLPNFGPAVYCYGEGRCRCRLVPRPA